MNTFTAITKKVDGWWIGWIEEISGVNCQERTYEELIESLKEALQVSVISTERSERRNLILPETDSSIPLRSTRNDMKNVNYLVTLGSNF